MATPSSPFSFLDDLFNRIGERLQPPAWAVHEIQHRAVLFLNHVLQQEPEAQQRLLRQQGRVVRFQWRFVTMELVATPADPGFWLRFRSGPVLTYPRTLRSGPRESLARSQAWRAGS